VTVPFAKGQNALAECDRCGAGWRLGDLKYQYVAAYPTNLKVCPDCLDQDHPQLLLGRYPVVDPIAIYDPRPDVALIPSRSLFGWTPVGDDVTLQFNSEIGTVSTEET